MFVLLAILFMLSIEKTICQVQESQGYKYLPSDFVPARTTLSGYLQKSQPSQATENSNIFDNKNSTTTTQQTTKNQQKLKLLISRFQPSQMDQRRPFVNIATTDNTTNNAQNNSSKSKQISTYSTSSINDKIVFKDQGVFMGDNSVMCGEQVACNSSTSDNSRPPDSVTTVPPPVNVTVVDRGAFDGDACPTGYVRVNGVCVMPD